MKQTEKDQNNDNSLEKSLNYYINQLFNWLSKNGWAGWDPYDIWDNKVGIWMMSRKNIISRIAAYLTFRFDELAPITLRRLLKVKPKINPKAMGLFAASFLELESLEGTPRIIETEPVYMSCFQWLDENRVTRYGGCGWGYPFDWKSRMLIPRNTPTVVNSAIMGDAYWLKYKLHGDKKALNRCEEICQFIVNGLNRSTPKENGSFCFSYTPIDNFQVHNANLFGAEFLVRIGIETKREDWVKTGINAGRFSLSEIREDGTLNYWSNEQAKELQQDTYHSGFEIRAFDSIARLTGDLEFRKVANNYFSTWLRDYFSRQGVPCFSRGSHNIVEVHSCAESLFCISKLSESGILSVSDIVKHITKILNVSIDSLWTQLSSDCGYFAYIKRKRFGMNIKMNIPMIRWGEAWMFRALVSSFTAIKHKS